MKILCCGFFPALQRTIEYDSFREDKRNLARRVSVAVGGKATNTARVLKTLGADPLMLSFAGGFNGKTVRDLLDRESLPCHWVETKTETRICQTLLSDDQSGCTELVEDSAPLSSGEWRSFVKTFARLQGAFDFIVFSGNLPPHAPQEIYAELLARTAGRNVLIDTSGTPLFATLEHRPALVKINADELYLTVPDAGGAEEAARELIARGAGAVGITAGKKPAMLVASGGVKTFTLPPIKEGNPIGSGDAVSAGTAFSLAGGHPLSEAFLFGLACGTSNAMNMELGCVKPEQIAEVAPQIRVE